MSTDLWLESIPCTTCKHKLIEGDFNITSNLAPMWYEVFPDDKNFISINGMTGKQSLIKLNYFKICLIAQPEKFIKLNHENGWGTYEGLLGFINYLIICAKSYPDYIWNLSC
jgi:hypothetical protein